MTGYRRFFRLGVGRSQELQQELDQEIETHITLRIEDLVARGMSPASARKRRLAQQHQLASCGPHWRWSGCRGSGS